jgi:hypothetical protein
VDNGSLWQSEEWQGGGLSPWATRISEELRFFEVGGVKGGLILFFFVRTPIPICAVTPFARADDSPAIVDLSFLLQPTRWALVTSSTRCCPPDISPVTVDK